MVLAGLACIIGFFIYLGAHSVDYETYQRMRCIDIAGPMSEIDTEPFDKLRFDYTETDIDGNIIPVHFRNLGDIIIIESDSITAPVIRMAEGWKSRLSINVTDNTLNMIVTISPEELKEKHHRAFISAPDSITVIVPGGTLTEATVNTPNTTVLRNFNTDSVSVTSSDKIAFTDSRIGYADVNLAGHTWNPSFHLNSATVNSVVISTDNDNQRFDIYGTEDSYIGRLTCQFINYSNINLHYTRIGQFYWEGNDSVNVNITSKANLTLSTSGN